jgi:putative DNA primase/helicase
MARRVRKRRVVETYCYRHQAGSLRSQTVRYEPKRFSQRQPDGTGGWIWNLDSVELVPYRLPELLAAPPDKTVFIPEGEKDVEALRGLGLVATCNAMGAGKWREEFGRHLEGRDVVVLPDNDEAGRAHGRDVAGMLAGHAARVCIVEMPPPHKDVSDWIVHGGGTAARLLQMVGGHPPPVRNRRTRRRWATAR